jgi:hypothetical protein
VKMCIHVALTELHTAGLSCTIGNKFSNSASSYSTLLFFVSAEVSGAISPYYLGGGDSYLTVPSRDR